MTFWKSIPFGMKEFNFKCETYWKGVVRAVDLCCHLIVSCWPCCLQGVSSNKDTHQFCTHWKIPTLCTFHTFTRFAVGLSLAIFSVFLTLGCVSWFLFSMGMTTSGHGKSIFGLRWFDLTQQFLKFLPETSSVFRCTKLIRCSFFIMVSFQLSQWKSWALDSNVSGSKNVPRQGPMENQLKL